MAGQILHGDPVGVPAGTPSKGSTPTSCGLSSPDLPINLHRRQGMRMGNTFSRALDPSKPLLFGDFPLGILEEEVWHPTAATLSWQNPLTCTATSSSSPDLPISHDQSNPAGQKTSHGGSEQKKSSGSPDAVAWSSDHETDSDDSLQPYDLEEEEDNGKAVSHCLT